MTARLYRLTEMHQKLDEALRREINRRSPDAMRVMAIKRRKLRLKDIIRSFQPSPARG